MSTLATGTRVERPRWGTTIWSSVGPASCSRPAEGEGQSQGELDGQTDKSEKGKQAAGNGWGSHRATRGVDAGWRPNKARAVDLAARCTGVGRQMDGQIKKLAWAQLLTDPAHAAAPAGGRPQ